MKDFHIHDSILYAQWRLLIEGCQKNLHIEEEKYSFQSLERLYKFFRRGPSEFFVLSAS